MLVEKKESLDAVNVEQPTTDGATDELVTASQEATLQKKTETPEQLEQKERSNLGRKVKKLEETLVEMNEALQELRTQRQIQNTTQTQSDLPEYVSTPDDVERILTSREKRQKDERDRYQVSYSKTFRDVGREDPELYEEVFNEMYSNFNIVRTGDASIDAELNYAKAKASVLSKKTSQPKAKPNIKGSNQTASTNLSVDSRAEENSASDVQLDDFAKEFVSKTGMKTDSINNALKGDVPAHIRK